MKPTRIEIHGENFGMGFAVKPLTEKEVFALEKAIKAFCGALEEARQ